MEFKHTTLDNGLTIAAEVNPQAQSMAVGFFARTGSRDETPEVSGVSHFLEHMMFKGTERRTAFDVNREFDELGANYNAFTSEENTVYYAAVLPEFQAQLMDLMGDMLRPSLRQDDFDIEKNVILEEIALYEDQPQFRVYDWLMSQYFHDHPLGNMILGTKESIETMKRDDMQAYFDRRYSPTNVTLVAVGNVDFDALVEQARTHCGRWVPLEAPRHVEPANGATNSLVVHDPSLVRETVAMMSAAPSAQDEARYAATLASVIVGDVSGSRLYYALVDPAVADEAVMSYSPMDGAGTFMTFLSGEPGRSAEILQIARDVIGKFLEEGPTETELQAAKNKIATAATAKGELPMGRLTSVGFDWVYRQAYVPLMEQIETLFTATTGEVLDVARTYDMQRCATLALGPAETIE
ncbi:MAG: M16 family metallopeptidase [Phycisphaerae bacterium]